MYRAKAFLLLLGLQLLVSLISCVQANLVRLNLEKKFGAQNGHLGQPLTSYYANVGVGTPPKDYKMLLDVNGRETWLPHYSRAGLVLGRLNYRDGYSKKDSSTSTKENLNTYTISYKTSEFSGKAYRDLFELRNLTESANLVKVEQRFLAISSASNDHFTKFGVDGVLAINPWPLSETGSEMITVGLVRANLISELRVGLSLDQDESTKYGGELTFGGINPTKFLGALRFHQVTTHHSWELNLNGVMLGRDWVGCNVNDRCAALVSTNSNDLYGPPGQVKKILASLGYSEAETKFYDQKLYDIDCLKVAQAPTITFIIDDAYYTLPPTSYIRKKTDGVLFKSQSCYIAILSNGSANKWELGTNFLANYYTVFDLNLRKIALASRTST